MLCGIAGATIIRDRVAWDEDYEHFEEPETPEDEEWMFEDDD